MQPQVVSDKQKTPLKALFLLLVEVEQPGQLHLLPNILDWIASISIISKGTQDESVE
jgi:hypothetical protein